MTNKEITEAMAVNIMKWHEKNGVRTFPMWFDENNEFVKYKHAWDPMVCIDDAIQIAEKFEYWLIKTKTGRTCRLFVDGKEVSTGHGDTPEEAICNAAIKYIEEVGSNG